VLKCLRWIGAYGTINKPHPSSRTRGLAWRYPLNRVKMISDLLQELPAMVVTEGAPSSLPDEIEAYCVKCKTSHTMVGPQLVTTKNGRSAARGKCPVCRTTMMKFLPAR
jgi:hypothetical protein